MGHWYEQDGTPKHWQEDGKDTTLRHARKQNLYPSVTTIGNIKYKFGLERWKIDTVCRYALTQDADADVRTVSREAFEELDRQADAGTDIHDILEKFHADPYCKEALDNQDLCNSVAACVMDNTGIGFHGKFKSETRFCDTEHGYAGMCDLHTAGRDDFYDGLKKSAWVIDYKSKDTVDEKTRGYKEQAEQLAAYAHGLGIPNARLANVFISREDPTQVVWYEHKDEWAWERFRHALMMWQVENKYGPYFDRLNNE